MYVNDLNTVIGKNESGKSNLLDLLGDIGFIGASDDKLFLKNNKKSDKPVKVELVFETRKDEYFTYGNYNGEVRIVLEKDEVYRIDKKFGSYITSLPEYKSLMKKILELKGEVQIPKLDNRTKLLTIIERFEKVNENIFVEPNFWKDFIRLMKSIGDIKTKELITNIEKMRDFLEEIYMNIPAFVKIKNIDLKNRYTIAELKEALELFNEDSILYQFFNVCEIKSKDLINTMEKNESARIRGIENDIQKLINEKFVKKFNEFYSQEIMEIAIDIKNDSLDIMIKTTDGAYLDYTERSNGFKWYISIFIQLLYKKKYCEEIGTYVLLLDEPGVYLHANAQKELRKLLEDLARNKEQVIYTTHSPFMIDKDDLLSIRTLMKDDNGYTHIYNKVTEIPIEAKSRYETITPLLYALGCEGAYDIEPSHSMCNIITEGVTDFYYLVGYKECLKENLQYKIVPSNGGDDIPAIANILFGWGCEFVILLDQDQKGEDVYKKLQSKNSPFIDRILFVDGTKISNKSADFEIENIFSDEDKEKFNLNATDYGAHKYNYATAMLTKVKSGDDKYSEETMKNFENLFEKIEEIRKTE